MKKLILCALAALALLPVTIHGLGSCSFWVSCQNGQFPNIIGAWITCTNGYNHDPQNYWGRGYWSMEIPYCYWDTVTVQLAGCATNNSNHCLKLHSIPPYGQDTYDYGDTASGSSKTRFQLMNYCSTTNAYAFAANILEWWCNPE